ncbi:TlpA family protein disulfide reductase [Anaerophaga thermohalophila]|jgi:thiol-disulfide isomerase/thioredoxin|uniref:TlpA family protein disulfide reductase n=1 Tax=Anaerophaga thermohalophila TaxID=177400 RepID=UPI0003150880|nr:thioredoxin-like domain-containing protein [Anaerophaga thermohalophila]
MRNKLLLITILAGILFLSFINGSPEPQVGTDVGNKVPDINRPLINGVPFHSDSLRGKMVLYDFWASYDAPSRLESYKKREVYQRFHNQTFLNGEKFVIVSISLDRFKTPLMQVIESDSLFDMYHICTFEGRDSEIARKFDATRKMKDYLVDGHGRIVAVGTSIEEIEQDLVRLQR